MPDGLSLALIGAAAGAGLLWVFGKTSDQAAIRRTKKKLQAYLLEIRLYGDEPALIWRAQRNLLAANARYFALMLKPAAVVALPMIVLLALLDGYYGRRPLAPGEAAVLTVQLAAGGETGGIRLEVPPGIVVETPAVRAPEQGQVSWRIRALQPARGELHVVAGDTALTKSVAAGAERRLISSRRVGSPAELLLHPGEWLLPDAGVDWIELDYPVRRVRVFGLEAHWLVWFLVFSMAAALLLKGKFRVSL